MEGVRGGSTQIGNVFPQWLVGNGYMYEFHQPHGDHAANYKIYSRLEGDEWVVLTSVSYILIASNKIDFFEAVEKLAPTEP